IRGQPVPHRRPPAALGGSRGLRTGCASGAGCDARDDPRRCRPPPFVSRPRHVRLPAARRQNTDPHCPCGGGQQKWRASPGHESTRPGAGAATMIEKLIAWSIRRRDLVALGALFALVAGLVLLRTAPVDAIPDLSDTQVIVYTDYAGQAPQVVEDQVTYPLVTTFLGVPRVKVVRGQSMFSSSFVYVIFQDGTDLYWARSRVLEYLNAVQSRLPAGAKTRLGP